MNALLLLSGGLDSATLLAALKDQIGLCVGFDYGQPHAIELERAAVLAERYGKAFQRVEIPNMPRVNDVVFAGRNAVLLTTGAAIAQVRGLDAVVIGCNWSDLDRFPDCRPAFLRPIGEALRAAYGVSVVAPLLHMTKTQVVQEARRLDVPLDLTWTCYAPTESGDPCGECYSCRGRAYAEQQQ